MVLIFSDEYEVSTDDVIDWLLFQKTAFIRINETNQMRLKEMKLTDNNWQIILSFGQIQIDMDKINYYWYRRGHFNLMHKPLETSDPNINLALNSQMIRGLTKIEELIHLKARAKKHIGSYIDNSINKLDVLQKAVNVGLKVPKTIVTCRRAAALDFCESNHNNIITKAISDRFQIDLPGMSYYANTILLTKEKINDFQETFSPTLFQECLKKKYELRIFYLDGACYSSVIFSQNDVKTSVDFRNYNHEKPNRVCPFILPVEIGLKITELMTSLRFSSGSIDIVVDINNEFIFLEVNPVGQFKQVSSPCNYYLEKIIAAQLSC